MHITVTVGVQVQRLDGLGPCTLLPGCYSARVILSPRAFPDEVWIVTADKDTHIGLPAGTWADIVDTCATPHEVRKAHIQ